MAGWNSWLVIPTFSFVWVSVVWIATASGQEKTAVPDGKKTASAREAKSTSPVKPDQWLLLAAGARGGRTPVRTDLLEKQLILGPWKTPKEGDFLGVDEKGADKKKWVAVKPAEDGSIRHPGLAGGYALWALESPEARTMVLEARGNGMVYVNGEPRPGDPYGNGYLALPVSLKKGTNEFLFFGGRGAISASLRAPLGNTELSKDDATLPDIVAGKPAKHWGGLVVRNCTDKMVTGLTLKAKVGSKETTQTVPTLLPLGLFKVPFEFEIEATEKPDIRLDVSLWEKGDQIAKQDFKLTVKEEGATRKVTFLSEIDRSVQYFGLVPAKVSKTDSGKEKPGLILSLHGASVEGIGQAACYAPKPWAFVAAPTNRRPFGFDWEDWGRMDAMEVLDQAQKSLGTDPLKTWVTGHSMGGHGTWHLGVTYPDRFAAIGPSAGWVSMFSYAGVRKPEAKSSVAKMLARATNPSDTVGLVSNLAPRGVYILHGDADDNVPVTQARTMRQQLSGFHTDFSYYERKGAGHWWGNECVDWPTLVQFFQDRKLPVPGSAGDIEFRTYHPGISSKMGWLEIRGQKEWGDLSEARFKRNLIQGTIQGTTRNIDRIRFFAMGWPLDAKVHWTIDGDEGEASTWGKNGFIELVYLDKKWKQVEAPDDLKTMKTPQRAGPIKEGFRNRMIYVIGTNGTPEENQANLAKARFDQETFYYRGNGAIEVTTDAIYLKNPDSYKGRNLILVGNQDNNKAWKGLTDHCPIQFHHGHLDLPKGPRIEGEDKGGIVVYPKKGEPLNHVVLIGSTGARGMKLMQRLSLWVSGSSFPDFLIMDSSMLADGIPGVIAAGYFDSQWGWDPTQAALR